MRGNDCIYFSDWDTSFPNSGDPELWFLHWPSHHCCSDSVTDLPAWCKVSPFTAAKSKQFPHQIRSGAKASLCFIAWHILSCEWRLCPRLLSRYCFHWVFADHALGQRGFCPWLWFWGCSISQDVPLLNPELSLLCLSPGGLGGTRLSPTLAHSTEVRCSCRNWVLKCEVDVYVEFLFGTDAALKSESCWVGRERCLLLCCSSVAGLQSTT